MNWYTASKGEFKVKAQFSEKVLARCQELRDCGRKPKVGDLCWLETDGWIRMLGRGPEWIIKEIDGVYAKVYLKSLDGGSIFQFVENLVPYVEEETSEDLEVNAMERKVSNLEAQVEAINAAIIAL